jgi:hypothetical protein
MMVDDFTQYEFLTCGKCGIRFAAPRHFIGARRAGDQGVTDFYCPNGHCRVFRETETDRLRHERDNLRQQMARVEDERAEAIAARQKAERELKRTQTRAGAGVCPCCNRSFRSLALHMKNKHPEVVPMQVKRG